jgi:hypothetical protein
MPPPKNLNVRLGDIGKQRLLGKRAIFVAIEVVLKAVS